MIGDIYNIPHSISAETVISLRAKMLENNLMGNAEYTYYQIVHDGRQFHAFYMKTAVEKNSILKKTKKTLSKD
jgi:hypothetical protein